MRQIRSLLVFSLCPLCLCGELLRYGPAMPDLAITLGRLHLHNPVLVASGTFGYAREMAGVIDFAKLGGVIPKTVTRHPRAGNAPPRTVETASGMLNAIGVGGIATIDDVMEFLVAGASAVQLGTVNFYDPTAAPRIGGQLGEALAELGAGSVREVVGTLAKE